MRRSILQFSKHSAGKTAGQTQKFNKQFTFSCLFSGRDGITIAPECKRKEADTMNGTNWGSLADLEDLIYENQKTVASER